MEYLIEGKKPGDLINQKVLVSGTELILEKLIKVFEKKHGVCDTQTTKFATFSVEQVKGFGLGELTIEIGTVVDRQHPKHNWFSEKKEYWWS